MERCPTCKAIFRGEPICSRCGTNLAQILGIERAAMHCQQEALSALRRGFPWAAYRYARRACDLHRSSDSVKALALAALACQKFDEAVALWEECGGNRKAQWDESRHP